MTAVSGAQLFKLNNERDGSGFAADTDQNKWPDTDPADQLWSSLYINYIFNICNCHCAHLAGTDFDVEVVPLVGDLEDFGPSEPVDPQSVSVDEQATCTNSQHDLYTLRVMDTTHTKK